MCLWALLPFGCGKADFVEYACERSNGYSVVGDWDVLLLGLADAIEHMGACEQASSAMYDQVVGCEVGREIIAGNMVYV